MKEREVLVIFKDSVKSIQAMQVLEENETDPQVSITEETIAQKEPILVEISDDLSVPEAVEQLKNDPAVEYTQPNYLYKLLETEPSYEELKTIINDPYKSEQWYLDNTNISETWDIKKTIMK